MKTQEITVAIKATVPVGKYCDDEKGGCCEKVYYERDETDMFCNAFDIYLNNDKGSMLLLKCPQCLDACECSNTWVTHSQYRF